VAGARAGPRGGGGRSTGALSPAVAGGAATERDERGGDGAVRDGGGGRERETDE
jgi:hypothetical protein